MKIADILPAENIKIPLKGTTKDEIIVELVEVLTASNPSVDGKIVLNAVVAREQSMSTGIGHGVAIPHGKSNGVKDIAAVLGIAPDGVEFEALDGEAVYLFILISAPEGPSGPHLRYLSLISRLLNQESFRTKLIGCMSPREALSLISEGEQNILSM